MQLLHSYLSLSGDLTIIVQVHPLQHHIFHSLQRETWLQTQHFLLVFWRDRWGTKIEGMLDRLLRNALWFFRTKGHFLCALDIYLFNLLVSVLGWISWIVLHDGFDYGFNGEQIHQFGFELRSAHHGNFWQHFRSVGWQVLSLLAGLGAKSSLKSHFSLTVEWNLILLQLPFKAKIGADIWPGLTDKGYGLSEAPALLLHEVGDDEGGRLHVARVTLDIPAAQCTSTFFLLNSLSISS